MSNNTSENTYACKIFRGSIQIRVQILPLIRMNIVDCK